MTKKRVFITILFFIAIMIIISFLIPKETKPSPDTRIILEHNYKTYIAPRCFQDADATNYIQDSVLEEAQYLNYDPHDSCTETELESEMESMFISLLKDIGFLNKKWDNW